eukprot:Pgem_evm1s9454
MSNPRIKADDSPAYLSFKKYAEIHNLQLEAKTYLTKTTLQNYMCNKDVCEMVVHFVCHSHTPEVLYNSISLVNFVNTTDALWELFSFFDKEIDDLNEDLEDMDQCIPPKAEFNERKTLVLTNIMPCISLYFTSHYSDSVGRSYTGLL